MDADFERLQERYVQWRDTLSQIACGRTSLANALDLCVAGGGSLWWASTVAATPPETLDRVADILKLQIVEQIAENAGCTHVTYAGDDERLAAVLETWCRSQKRTFARSRMGAARRTMPHRPLRHRVPHPLQALWSLASFVRRRLRISPAHLPAGVKADAPDVAIVTYVPNVNAEAAAAGRFESNYWGSLHRLIGSLGLKVRWIWFLTGGSDMPIDAAVSFRDRLNAQAGTTGQSHAFVEERVGLAGVGRAVARYLRLVRTGMRCRSIRRSFRLPGSSIDFFPLLEEQWRSSMYGAHAMFLALYSVAFQTAVAQVPEQTSRLFYIWENQSWEFLLLDAWKTSRAAPVFGVAHTPTCASPMLMRNRIGLCQAESARRLGPDRLVTIGPAAAGALRAYGWPAGSVVEGEALRFEHLVNRRATATPRTTGRRRLLVLSGILESEARLQLDLLAEAERLGALDEYSEVVVKAHPFRSVDTLVRSIPFVRPPRVVEEPLDALLSRADVVFVAGGTSVSVEASWVGLPLIILGAVDGLNLSPFRAVDGVQFVMTASELAAQLRNPSQVTLDPSYFLFDDGLPRWRAMLTGRVSAASAA